MPSRYRQRKVKQTSGEQYREILTPRRISALAHYATPILSNPSAKQHAALQRVQHIWKTGDRFCKLSHKYYGDSELWWIIAWYNKKPTESHVNYGDKIYIPLPLESVYLYLRST